MLEDISKEVINFVFKFTVQERRYHSKDSGSRMTTIKASAEGAGLKMTPEQSDSKLGRRWRWCQRMPVK
jgi:hypothetical protein